MEIVIHRVNQRARLAQLAHSFGAEIDLRASGSQLILQHDVFKAGESFDEWLQDYRHGLLVVNIKEAGIEAEVIRKLEQRQITNFFLLDVEFPYLYRASREGERRIAIRYSEAESIETVRINSDRVDWVWIDTNTRLPLNEDQVRVLRPLKTCLVCPERWGRPEDIVAYQQQMRALNFWPTAVMTAATYADQWRNQTELP